MPNNSLKQQNWGIIFKIRPFLVKSPLGCDKPLISILSEGIPLKLRADGRNIVGCYMLRLFAHPVVCCCVLLGVVTQRLKPVKVLAVRVQTDATTPNNVALGVDGPQCCVRLHWAGIKTKDPFLLNSSTSFSYGNKGNDA